MAAYTETFQSGGAAPYPLHPTWQFEYAWFNLWLEFVIWLGAVAIVFIPSEPGCSMHA